MDVSPNPPPRRFHLRFRPLLAGHSSLAFPCDETGRVDLDALSEAARTSYLFARTVIGRAFASPTILIETRH